MDIYKSIKTARENSKLSQAAVGALFEPSISRAAVAQWEAKGGTVPELWRLPILAAAFKCSIDQLLGVAPLAAGAAPASKPLANLELLADGALDVAHAWSALPEQRKEIYREMIFRDASMNDVAPHLYAVPIKASYFKMMSSIRHHHDKALRQLGLPF